MSICPHPCPSGPTGLQAVTGHIQAKLGLFPYGQPGSECEHYSVQRCPIALQRVQELGGAAGRRSNGECSLAVKRMTIPPARVALSGRTAGRRKRNAADAILVVLRGSVRPLPPAVRPAEFDERRLAQPVRMNNVLGNHSYPHRPQASMGRVI